jgi:uncharacterized protein (DUF433 family)
MANLLDRITINPEICHGKPTIRGLRYPVETILELLSAGITTEEILADYEDLERQDILAVLAFAALEEAAGQRTSKPILHHDLDFLAGTWSDAEATAFEASLAEQRRVEPRFSEVPQTVVEVLEPRPEASRPEARPKA